MKTISLEDALHYVRKTTPKGWISVKQLRKIGVNRNILSLWRTKFNLTHRRIGGESLYLIAEIIAIQPRTYNHKLVQKLGTEEDKEKWLNIQKERAIAMIKKGSVCEGHYEKHAKIMYRYFLSRYKNGTYKAVFLDTEKMPEINRLNKLYGWRLYCMPYVKNGKRGWLVWKN